MPRWSDTDRCEEKKEEEEEEEKEEEKEENKKNMDISILSFLKLPNS